MAIQPLNYAGSTPIGIQASKFNSRPLIHLLCLIPIVCDYTLKYYISGTTAPFTLFLVKVPQLPGIPFLKTYI